MRDDSILNIYKKKELKPSLFYIRVIFLVWHSFVSFSNHNLGEFQYI